MFETDIDFGKYAVIENARHYLSKSEDEEWFWEFKPITAGDELAMVTFVQRGREIVNDSGEKVSIPHTNQALAIREVAQSFGATNIPGKDGNPILQLGDPIEKKEAVIKSMPYDLFQEIWTALGEAHPFWGPLKEAEEKDIDEKE